MSVEIISVHISKTAGTSFRKVFEQIGDELYEKLLEVNRFDLELYDHALKLFEKRVEEIKKGTVVPRRR